jgi:hypothetical protein
MVIGLEWLVIVLFAIFIILWIVGLLVHKSAGKLSTILVLLAVVCECTCGALCIGVVSAQKNINKHFIDYLKLQARVVQYEDLDVAEQYKVADDVMTYNLWYERNKSDLDNPWTFKGTSDHAKEFNYILIGG